MEMRCGYLMSRYIPSISSNRPMERPMAYVYVFFHIPSTREATVKRPKTMAKKMPDPRFG
jgi:hypothetical protein